MALSLQEAPFGRHHYRRHEKVWAIPHQQGGPRRKHADSPKTMDAMMMERKHWKKKHGSEGELRWTGKQETQFERVYLLQSEFLPLTQMQMYGVSVNIPQRPWDILRRL